jgi:hypothetical protein
MQQMDGFNRHSVKGGGWIEYRETSIEYQVGSTTFSLRFKPQRRHSFDELLN